eukprot:6961985-Lingulodinium_polyedra.AAC.1
MSEEASCVPRRSHGRSRPGGAARPAGCLRSGGSASGAELSEPNCSIQAPVGATAESTVEISSNRHLSLHSAACRMSSRLKRPYMRA